MEIIFAVVITFLTILIIPVIVIHHREISHFFLRRKELDTQVKLKKLEDEKELFLSGMITEREYRKRVDKI